MAEQARKRLFSSSSVSSSEGESSAGTKKKLKGKLKWQRSKSGSKNSILGTAAWSGSGVIEKSLIKVRFLRYGVKFVENTRTRFKE